MCAFWTDPPPPCEQWRHRVRPPLSPSFSGSRFSAPGHGLVIRAFMQTRRCRAASGPPFLRFSQPLLLFPRLPLELKQQRGRSEGLNKAFFGGAGCWTRSFRVRWTINKTPTEQAAITWADKAGVSRGAGPSTARLCVRSERGVAGACVS